MANVPSTNPDRRPPSPFYYVYRRPQAPEDYVNNRNMSHSLNGPGGFVRSYNFIVTRTPLDEPSTPNQPIFTTARIAVAADTGNCRICLADFQVGDELIETVCNHTFHENCLKNWLRYGENCPLCRTLIE